MQPPGETADTGRSDRRPWWMAVVIAAAAAAVLLALAAAGWWLLSAPDESVGGRPAADIYMSAELVMAPSEPDGLNSIAGTGLHVATFHGPAGSVDLKTWDEWAGDGQRVTCFGHFGRQAGGSSCGHDLDGDPAFSWGSTMTSGVPPINNVSVSLVNPAGRWLLVETNNGARVAAPVVGGMSSAQWDARAGDPIDAWVLDETLQVVSTESFG